MRQTIVAVAVLVVAVAMLAASATTALGAGKHLLVTLEGRVLTPADEVQANFNESWELKTTGGAYEAFCESYEAGSLTVNNSAKDVFVAGAEREGGCYAVEDPELGGGGELEITPITFGANGKATAAVKISFSGPPPFQSCVYAGKLKGTNATSGELAVNFAGKLKGTGCHIKNLVLVNNLEDGFMSAVGGLPSLEVQVF